MLVRELDDFTRVLVEPGANDLYYGVYKPVLIYKNVSVWTSLEELCLNFQKALEFEHWDVPNSDIFHVEDEEHALDLAVDHHFLFDPPKPEGEVLFQVFCTGFLLFEDLFYDFVNVYVQDWLMAELSHSTHYTNSASINKFPKLLGISRKVVLLYHLKILVRSFKDLFIRRPRHIESVEVHKLKSKSRFRREYVAHGLEPFLFDPILKPIPLIHFPLLKFDWLTEEKPLGWEIGRDEIGVLVVCLHIAQIFCDVLHLLAGVGVTFLLLRRFLNGLLVRENQNGFPDEGRSFIEGLLYKFVHKLLEFGLHARIQLHVTLIIRWIEQSHRGWRLIGSFGSQF